MSDKPFDASEADVIAGADCTWCDASVGEPCMDLAHGYDQLARHTHAQRWYDFWNATHDKAQHRQVVRDPKRARREHAG